MNCLLVVREVEDCVNTEPSPLRSRIVKITVVAVILLAALLWAFFLAPGTEKMWDGSGSTSSDSASSESTNPSATQSPTDLSNELVCTISIRCDTILHNLTLFNEDKLFLLPEDGTILPETTMVYSDGESAFAILQRATREQKLHLEYKFTPLYNAVYIQGIHNLYEFDCGALSGWMYAISTNDEERRFPNYGADRYTVQPGDHIEWIFTCDLGRDIGGGFTDEP